MNNFIEIHILAISGLVLPFIVFFFDIKCIFKEIFKIPCISCGMTRAFLSILKFDFIGAIKYNVLSIPIFIFIILFYSLYLLKIVFNNKLINIYYLIIVKKINIIIYLLLLGWITNIIIYFVK